MNHLGTVMFSKSLRLNRYCD